MTGAGEVAFFLAAGAAAVGVLVGPVGSALARRLGGVADSETAAELDELRGRLQRIEAHQDRLAEVESRLDFAERLLAQHQGGPPLGLTRDSQG
ncbi:MAG TPA: hypothetical protein VFT84_03350 [Gemmatimonadales bacterium]|nr:hypothetical protein [Gemmatimonadales bacterium]